MLVKALVRSVVDHLPPANDPSKKPFAVVAIETDQPLEISEIRCFANAINDGTVAKLRSAVGRKIMLPLTAGIYQGKLQMQITFGAVIELPAPQQKGS